MHKEQINFDGLVDGLKGFQAETNAILNKLLTPEIVSQMTPEQRAFVKEGQNAFTVKTGETYAEKAERLTQILKDNAISNKL